MTKSYTKQQGYLQLPTEQGTKWMHFSMNFLVNLQELTEKDVSTWGRDMREQDPFKQGLSLCELMYASLAAFDQEEGNDIDYNIYKVTNWGLEAMNNDDKLAANILEAMTNSLGKYKEKPKAKE